MSDFDFFLIDADRYCRVLLPTLTSQLSKTQMFFNKRSVFEPGQHWDFIY